MSQKNTEVSTIPPKTNWKLKEKLLTPETKKLKEVQ